jgi:hypothetical protein
VIYAIEKALAPLRGLRLWAAGRAADMLWLEFGERLRAPTERDPEREVGEFAIHVMCPWRIAGSGGVITGRSDIFVPSDPDEDEDKFRWDRPGRSIVDQQLSTWIEAHEERPLIVLEITVDRCAGFALRLDDVNSLDVFPDAFSMPHDIREHWRILQPAKDTPHFVVNNQGWG